MYKHKFELVLVPYLVLALLAWTLLALCAFHTPIALQGLGEAVSQVVCIH